MFNPANLDDRERAIYDDADQWWATRFLGQGHYDKLGPFNTSSEVVAQIMRFFRLEEHAYPPPSYIAVKPFAVYASSAKHGGSHVMVGNVYRDGQHRPSHTEVSRARQEAKALATKKRKSSRSRNSERPA